MSRVQFLCPPLEATSLFRPDLGSGLVIQHGFATIIVAERIGARCWVNQQVTLGAGGSHPGFPTLGDEVHAGAGAKIIGGVVIGDRVVIGTNAVIVKDVPSDVTVVGIPARIVRRNGVRVDEKL